LASEKANKTTILAVTPLTESTVTNGWLGASLNMGSLHEVSRKVVAWARKPDTALADKLK
jgi:hypothetical protein